MTLSGEKGHFDDLFKFSDVKPKVETKTKNTQQTIKKTVEKGTKHDHPACKSDHVHEKAYVTSSAGGEITEGCIEHYFDRIVSSDPEKEAVIHVNGKAAEYIIMGEVLLNPKFKRVYRR